MSSSNNCVDAKQLVIDIAQNIAIAPPHTQICDKIVLLPNNQCDASGGLFGVAYEL
ncbi:hypothetical protein [Nostoc sp.]|uniref:hypothetical protein n=1 Tax=Nostoc sp. TaxID=1180 RepID=UPI002FF91992